MTVTTDLYGYVRYDGNGSTTVFPYPFKIFDSDELQVSLINETTGGVLVQTLGTDYTVSGVGLDGGGNVTMVTAPDADHKLDIRSVTHPLQETSFKNQGRFLPEVHETAFDRLTRRVQDLERAVRQSLRRTDYEEVLDWTLPIASTRKNNFLYFDSQGEPALATALANSTLSQATIGQYLYPQTVAEAAAGVTPTNYHYEPLDLRRYGGVGDGSTDNATALAEVVDVVDILGGEIYVPPGTFNFSAFPSLTNKQSIGFVGESPTNSGLARASRLVYTGTASPIITATSSQGIVFKNLQIIHNNAAFNGTYIKLGNDGANGDASFFYLLDCFIGANLGTGQVHLDLDKSINFTAERCEFFHGAPSVKGQAAAGGSYSNAIRFRDCEWNICTVAPIYDPGQAWTFDGCIFEQLSTDAAGAILSSNGTTTQVNGLSVRGCWFGDATTGGTWIDIAGQSIAIEGNYFGGNATATAINARTIHGLSVRSNTLDAFSVGIAFSGSCADVEVKANVFASVTTPFSGGSNVATGYADVGCNFGAGTLGATHEIIGNNGFMVLPNRIIEQWGSLTLTIGTPQAVTFATNGIAFPNACFNVVLTMQQPPGTGNAVWVSVAPSTTGFTVNGGGTAGTVVVYWRAVGY